MDQTQAERIYTYHTSWKGIILGSLMFAATGLFFGFKAYTNDRGLIINGIFELSANGASVFYWVLCGFSMAFVMMAALMAYKRLTHKQQIVLSPSGLLMPRPRWSGQTHMIAFDDIKKIVTVHGQMRPPSTASARGSQWPHGEAEPGSGAPSRLALDGARAACPREHLQKIELAEVYGQKLAHISHSGGKVSIVASMLPATTDFDEIVRTLTTHSTSA